MVVTQRMTDLNVLSIYLRGLQWMITNSQINKCLKVVINDMTEAIKAAGMKGSRSKLRFWFHG